MNTPSELSPRVYWLVVAAAVLLMAALWWFTATFNLGPEAAR
jgi:hypothetical protein